MCPPLSFNALAAQQPVNQLTPEQERGSQKTKALPLSILGVWSVDDRSKYAVTELGLLSHSVLTAQSRKKEAVVDYLYANTGTAE